ncbi:hypothetical protein OIU78_007212 [Salix suchowensis]|nr:hypothetical protein OIU78_007212 [Salix suchowensis]
MPLTRFRGFISLQARLSSHFLSRVSSFCSKPSTTTDKANEKTEKAPLQKESPSYSSKIHLPPLLSDSMPHLDGYNIELVDDDAWRVSSGLVHAWRGLDSEKEAKPVIEAFDEQFDDVESLHGKNSWRRKDDPKGNEKKESSKKNDNSKESKKKENPSCNSAFDIEKLPRIAKDPKVYTLISNMDSSGGAERKNIRTPTFNQLTGPYHEPFCLDIYISKASVRACVIHRVTSKVVAVAHSISKDFKFDLASTKNGAACAAVGGILAQRALADDIHDVVYTPRKGERLEGKLQIVLQAIIDNGINVKVKLKQRNP